MAASSTPVMEIFMALGGRVRIQYRTTEMKVLKDGDNSSNLEQVSVVDGWSSGGGKRGKKEWSGVGGKKQKEREKEEEEEREEGEGGRRMNMWASEARCGFFLFSFCTCATALS